MQKKKDEKPEKYKEDYNKANKKSRQKKIDEKPEQYKKENNADVRKWRQNKIDQNLKQYKTDCNSAKKKSRTELASKIGEKERIANFKMAVQFGPIFICSCCKRRLFENGVKKLTQEFKQKMLTAKAGLYEDCIPNEEIVNIILNGECHKTGYYLCHTCKITMEKGKMPAMSEANGLQLSKIKHHLT